MSRLFSGNVRGFLENTDVNKEIKKSLESNYDNFLALNNGIVLIVKDINYRGDDIIRITNPNIINGQQTVASIYMHSSIAKRSKTKVLIKIIKIKSESKKLTLDLLSRTSNQANIIDELDLLSNKPLFKYLIKKFIDEGIYFKIKDGYVLNDIYLKTADIYDVTEVIKMWVTLFMKRPDHSKVTKKNFKIFSDAYNYGNKTSRRFLSKKENFDNIYDDFKKSIDFIELMSKYKELYFNSFDFYDHGYYYIAFLINQMYSDNYNELNQEQANIIINNIKTIINKEKEINDSYTHNNFFKSARVLMVSDNKLVKVNEQIEELYKLEE